jgi:hypothetical protein
VVPTASATALSTSLPPIPISSELQAGNTTPKIRRPTFSIVSESSFFRYSAIISVFYSLFVVASSAE